MKFSRYKSNLVTFVTLIIRHLSIPNGDKGIRTLDPLLARQVLSQLSYTPIQVIHSQLLRMSGLKWTRTIDLTLIRRAL